MTDERPEPAMARECPYWGDPEDASIPLAYLASEANFAAALQAIRSGEIDALKAICETVEPRDYAAAAYLFIDFANSLIGVGVNANKTLTSLIEDVRSDFSAALAAQ